MKKYDKRIYKHFLRLAIAALCIAIGFNVSSIVLDNTTQENRILENSAQKLKVVEETTGISTNNNPNMLVLYYIGNNDNLDLEEKKIAYKLSNLLKDNSYMNVSLAATSIENMDITYDNIRTIQPEKVKGFYSYKDNAIQMFTSKEDTSSELLFHEYIHALFLNQYNYNLPNYLKEGVTELLTNEYFSENPFVEEKSYAFEINTVKILCEMVGRENVLNAYTTGNQYVIKEELLKILDEEQVNILLNNFEIIHEDFSKGGCIDSIRINQTLDLMDLYFSKKQEMTNDNSMINRYQYSREIFQMMNSETAIMDYLRYIYTQGVITKPYFSKDLIQKYPTSNITKINNIVSQ